MYDNIMILSAVHAIDGPRRHVYQFFLKRMSHIREKYGIQTLVVGNQGGLSRNLTEDAGLLYIEHENNPVSFKWNAGMAEVKKYSPKYVMIMGSDDFISDSLIDTYIQEADKGEFSVFGIRDSYYATINLSRAYVGMCLYWPGYPNNSIIGYARCWRSDVMDAINWTPWPQPANSGLDFMASVAIRSSGIPYTSKAFSIKEEGWLHIDIKTKGNISSITPILKRSTETRLDIGELLSKHLPEDEASDITEHFNAEVKLHNALSGR